MFRDKESSNRIELSRLVQDLLNFGVLGSLWLWGWRGGWMGVVGGCPHTHAHAWACIHVHACMCRHAHACMVNMVISCKWLPPLGETLRIPCDVICAYVCMCMHACTCMYVCVGGIPYHPPPTTYIHPPPTPRGDPRNQSKFNSTWTNQDISILFEDLKSVETFPPMGGCMVWWVGGCVDGLMGGVQSKH